MLCWIVEQDLFVVDVQLVLYCSFECQVLECLGDIFDCVNVLLVQYGVLFGLVYIFYLVCLLSIWWIIIQLVGGGCIMQLVKCVVVLLIGWNGLVLVGFWLSLVQDVFQDDSMVGVVLLGLIIFMGSVLYVLLQQVCYVSVVFVDCDVVLSVVVDVVFVCLQVQFSVVIGVVDLQVVVVV